MSLRSFGTHNLHDTAGVPTFFADVVLFTEAVPSSIRAKVRARRARLAGRLSGYTVRVCKDQRDLVVALRRRHYKVTGVLYFPAHGGRAEVSPHRGTFVVETIERATGRRVVFIVEHRVNAAFEPFIRGEAEWRADRWAKHTAMTEAIIRKYLRDGWAVRAGGDLNTPRLVPGYGLDIDVDERGTGLDRLASSDVIRHFEVLSRKGSDHPRLRAVA
jgi:hypothetical protein